MLVTNETRTRLPTPLSTTRGRSRHRLRMPIDPQPDEPHSRTQSPVGRGSTLGGGPRRGHRRGLGAPRRRGSHLLAVRVTALGVPVAAALRRRRTAGAAHRVVGSRTGGHRAPHGGSEGGGTAVDRRRASDSDHWDVVARPDMRDAVARAVARAIAARRDRWDVVHLDHLPSGSALERELRETGLRVASVAATPCPVLPLPASFDDYLGSLPRNGVRACAGRSNDSRPARFGSDRSTTPPISSERSCGGRRCVSSSTGAGR